MHCVRTEAWLANPMY